MDRYDVAIAGGGIIGLTIAYELCTRGFRVAVLDGTDARMASSYGNAGYVSPSLGPLSMNAREAEETARYLASIGSTSAARYVEAKMSSEYTRIGMPIIRSMALEGRDWYARMSSILGFVYRHAGMLEVYLTRDELERRVEHIRHLASALNIPYRILTRDEIHALEPTVNDACEGALLYPDDAFVNPRSVMKALRDALTALDAVFLGNLESIEWDGATKATTTIAAVAEDDDNSKRRVRSFKIAGASVYADTYVVCTGAYRVEGLDLPVAPARGYMLELLPKDRESSLMPNHTILCGEHRVAISVHEGLRITALFELCSIGSAMVKENFTKLLEWSRKYIALGDVVVVDRWTGYRPCTPDGLPIIGRVSDGDDYGDSNLIVACGHCRLGITLAPATARFVASLVEGRDDVPDAIKPNRYGL
ncbi:MAG: FAD-dependent oxidoreductase [Candidatus Nitrosocaldus sp.]